MTGQEASGDASTPTGTAVAVIGIGCRFPGATGPAALWRLLSNGVDAITDVPRSRYDIDAYHDPRPGTPGRIVGRQGGFLDQIDEFDAAYFGVAPREAEELDPQQRLLLETAAEALDDSGLTTEQLSGSRTGVFVGGMASTYWEMLSRAGVLDVYAASGGARSMLSGRLSFAFDLRGPSVSVDTACSSGLAALHLAYQSVRSGECGLALAGGVNLVASAEETIPFSQAKMLSPDSRCKFASATGDGFVRSEGVAVVVLKPLDRAEADGDAIYAVIYGSAVGNDGQSGGYLLTPSQAGQEETLRAAYADAGVAPGLVDYVEAHGTGTPAGDPVELGALGAVLGADRPTDRPLLVGSVKTNIGHTEAASGLAGFIKTVLALTRRQIPASLHAEQLTDAVDWAGLPLVLARTGSAWPETGRPGLAGVSSFGISGTNAHVVLGEYRSTVHAPVVEEGTAELLVLSTPHPRGLTALAERYADFLDVGGAGHELPLRDICFSTAAHRRHQESRLTVVGTSAGELAERLRAFAAGESRRRLGSSDELLVDAPGTRPPTVFVYPGQGSQWDGMGRELLATSAVFREIMTECDAVIRAEVGWSVLDRLTGQDATPASIDTVQPTLWAMETALTGLLRSWGIEPDYVIGHSMGEVAAAGAAGALSLADAGAVICRRSRLLREVAGLGAMVSVELSIEDARAELAGFEDRVSIAVSNSPTSTVLSGDPAALDSIVKTLDDRGVFCRAVKVDVASHSPQMDLLRDDLLSALGDIAPRTGDVPLFSTVDNAIRDGADLDAAYWVRNLREPVRFGAVVTQLAELGAAVFVEVSPHPILLTAIKECLEFAGGGAVALPCLRRDEPELASMLDTVGGAWRAGYPVDWSRVYAGRPVRYVRLPDYPWQRQRYWFTPVSPTVPAALASGTGHPLVGALVAQPAGTHRWSGVLDPARHPYLLDHRVQGTVVLPGTAYLEMLYATARQLTGADVPLLTDVHYENALFFLPGQPAPTLSITLTPQSEGGWSAMVTSRSGDDPADETVHATARVRAVPATTPEPLALDELRAGCPEHVTGTDFYQRFAASGNEWAGVFQGVAEIWGGAGQALGRIEVPAGVDLTGYTTHPALLDACGQVLASLITPDSGAAAFVLGGIDEVLIHPVAGRPAWSYVKQIVPWRSDSFSGDIVVADEQGRPLVEITGLRLQFLQPPGSVRDPRGWLHTVEWVPAPPAPEVATTGRLLVFADSTGIGAELAGSVVVTAGEGYRRLASGRYELNPTAAEGYQRLLADLSAEADGVPTDVVHLWSVDAEQAADATGTAAQLAAAAERLGCVSVLQLVQALGTARLAAPHRLWLATRGAQHVVDGDGGGSVWQAPVWGFGRTLAREYRDLRVSLVDLDPAGSAAQNAAALRRELAATDGEDQIAVRAGQRRLARLLPVATPAPAAQPDELTYELRTATPGILDGMRLEPLPRKAPGAGEVEVRADYLALNYRDVLLAMGHYPKLDDKPALFVGEGAGVVTRVGAGVAGLRPGDEVVMLALTTPSASYLCVNAHLVRPKPARLSLQEAATLPVGFLTAYHSLVQLAALKEGERVLIHHATGGVGMAAVQIALWKGAEVYATAGSPEKRALLRMMGVSHVADSRGLDFADSVLAATRGEGVHVVLNTLAGEGLEKSLTVLAARGRYVELSRRDLVEGTRLDMRLLARSISFFVVDVVDLGLNLAAQAGAVLDEVLRLTEAGVFHPLPHHVFPAADLVGAFRFMAQSKQIGKVLLDLTELAAEPVAATPEAPARPVRVDPDASYLVTGGLGDLGRVVTDWLVREGARHLVLVGRSPLSADSAGWLELLRRHGIAVDYEAVDVADAEAMRALLQRREAAGLPAVRGVVHAAGVILYRAVSDLDATALADVLRPKVAGGWVLHRLFAEQQLDFFVLFSSGSAVLSSPMLGAYSAANAALDALADHRRGTGLPALSVNWGFWSVGMPARAGEEQGRPINPQGIATFTPREGIETLRLLLARDATHAVVLAADWPQWRAAYPEAADVPLLRDLFHPTATRPAAAPPPVLPAQPAVPAPPVAASPARVSTTQPPVAAPAAVLPAVPIASPPTVVATPARPQPVVAVPAGGGIAATLTDQAAAEQYVRQVLAAVLGLPVADLQVRRALKRQGLDSLMAVEVRTRVERDLGLFLPIAKMLGGQSIADIAADVLDQLSHSSQSVPV